MSSKRALDFIDNAALRSVTDAFGTSPTSSILADVNEPPLSLRRCVVSIRYACKLCQFPDHPSYKYVFSRRFLAVFENSECFQAVHFFVRVSFACLLALSDFNTLHPILQDILILLTHCWADEVNVCCFAGFPVMLVL